MTVLTEARPAHRIPLFPDDESLARASAPDGDIALQSFGRTLSFTEQHQQQTNWCWDATTLSIHAYFDPDSTWTQCQFADLKLGRTDCCTNGSSSACNQGNWPDQALTLLGNFVATDTGAMSFAGLRSQIDAGRPISVRVDWSGGGAHNPAVIGYSSLPLTGEWVSVVDPWYGSSTVRYSTFCSAYQGSGSWTESYRTKSAPMQIGRARTTPGGTATVVSRDPSALDVFVTDSGRTIQTAALFETGAPASWQGWWPLNGGLAAPGAPVTAISRSTDKLDVFVTGTDGGVYTAAWEPGNVDWWHGWWRIGDVVAPQGAPVHAVSRSTDKLDIFVTDVHGQIKTAAWEPGNTDGWHGWWSLRGGRAAPGAAVTAVARATDKLDVFVTGTDGGVYTAAWEATNTDGWHGWWRIGDVVAPQGAPVHAVSRSTDKLDIFVTDVHGSIKTAAWEPANTDGWHGWWSLLGGAAAPGAPVTAVARSTDLLDVFVVGTDGQVYSAAWAASNADGWHGWWVFSQVRAAARTQLSPAARNGGAIDVVFAGADGCVYVARWSAGTTDGFWRG